MIATIFGIIAIIMWSTLAILGVNTQNIPAFQLLFVCFSISSLLMFIKRFITHKPLIQKPKLNCRQWLVGIVGLFGFHFCYFIALKNAPAIEVSLISYLWPMLLALFISNRTNIIPSLIGGIIGFIGVAIIITGGKSFSFNFNFLSGYLLALCCALLWSTYSWFQSRSDNQIDDIGWLSLVVATLSLFMHLLFEQSQWHFSVQQWISLVLLGLGPVGGAFYLWDIAMKKGNKKLLVSISYSTPLLSAMILALAGLAEWSNSILLSLSCILFGGLIANSKFSHANKKQLATE